MRESVLARLAPGNRKQWHARLALALEQCGQAELEELATHWHGADDTARATHYMLLAADASATTFAFDRAARLYRRALELGSSGDADARLVKHKLVEALTNAGRAAEAARLRLELADSASPLEALDMRRVAAEQLLCSGHMSEGLRTLGQVLTGLAIRIPESRLRVILSLILTRLYLTMRGVEFRERTPESIDPLQRMRVDCLWSAGNGFSLSDNVRGSYCHARNLRASLALGDAQRVARALVMEAQFYYGLGERTAARADKLVEEARRICARVDTPFLRAMMAMANGGKHYMLGRFWGGKPELYEAEALFRDHCPGSRFLLSTTRLMLHRVLGYRGDLRELRPIAAEAAREAEQLDDRFALINLYALSMVQLALANNDPESAKDALRSSRNWLSDRGYHVQHFLCLNGEVQVGLYTGQPGETYRRILAELPALKRSLVSRVHMVRSTLWEMRARAAVAAALASGKASEVEALLAAAERDVLLLEREGARWTVAAATLLRATVCAARSRTDEAQRLFGDAAEKLESVQMGMYAAAARRQLGLLRGNSGRELVHQADAWLGQQTVADPSKVAQMLAPLGRSATGG